MEELVGKKGKLLYSEDKNGPPNAVKGRLKSWGDFVEIEREDGRTFVINKNAVIVFKPEIGEGAP